MQQKETLKSPVTKRKKIIRWVLIILGLYITVGIVLYFVQERMLFHPVAIPFDQPYKISLPHREINLPVTEEKNLGIVQFTVPDSVQRGVVVFLHGNRANIEAYAPAAEPFLKANYEVWMLDYPGFGKSTGPRTEEIMYTDAALLFKMAKAEFREDSIIIYGRSMGSGVAAQLASRVDCRRLILETPYYSMYSLMRHYAFMYPISLMAKYELPTYRYLPEVDAPITIFHGTNDEVIPHSQAARLAKVKAGIDFIPVEGGTHNDLLSSPVYLQRLSEALR